MVLSYPSIESLITDLHCRCLSPESFLQLKLQTKAHLFHSWDVKIVAFPCRTFVAEKQIKCLYFLTTGKPRRTSPDRMLAHDDDIPIP
jgi:hypothetical protein